jgi:hypothetical protein
VEIKTTLDRVPDILGVVTEAAKTVDTVISIGVAGRCDAEGKNSVEKILDDAGYAYWRGKTNLGLGRRERSV